MAVGVPAARIGAEYPLGFVTQSSIGTPVAVPSTAGNWINQTANTLEYVTGAHMLKTAMGTRADEQESAQGETHLQGGFEANLRTSTSRALIQALLGSYSDTAGVRTATVSRPTLLTIEDNWANESHQYQDCMLSEANVSCGNHLEWKIAFTVMGGLSTLITSGTPTFSSTDKTLAWADVTGLSGLSAVAGQVSAFSFRLNNGVKMDYGAGQHAPTSVIGGEFTISGDCTIRYDSAGAATVDADYLNNVDLGPTTLTMGSGGTQATGTSTFATGAVTGVTVTNGGAGYNAGATVSFSGGGGTGAAGTVVQSGGVITGVTITAPGTGYTSAPTVTFSAPAGNQHSIYFPNITILTCTPQKPLDDFIRLHATFGVKQAQNFTWALPAS